LERALALYSVMPWHLFCIICEADIPSTEPCSGVLVAVVWQAMWGVVRPSLRLPRHPPLNDTLVQISISGAFSVCQRTGNR
jgi:hypothetical protein